MISRFLFDPQLHFIVGGALAERFKGEFGGTIWGDAIRFRGKVRIDKVRTAAVPFAHTTENTAAKSE